MAMELSECFVGGGCYDSTEFSPDKKAGLGLGAGEHFAVDDLLDFSNEEAAGNDARLFDNVNSAVDSNSSSLSGGDNQFSASFGCRSLGDSGFSGELCVPEWLYEDLAELEWLSNFVEDSFSTKHSLQQPLTALPGNPAAPKSSSSDLTYLPGHPTATTHHPIFLSEIPLPSKSRSKRPRAVPCDWTTRLLHLTPKEDDPAKPTKTSTPKKQRDPAQGPVEPRRCLHCASEKTPQWRTGPMGPKTLCNACGVRYKSGRLVPEYRPAASPTFISTKHSNSHRKVLELRRQKEAHRVTNHHHQFSPMFASGPNAVDEVLIGPGFRQLLM